VDERYGREGIEEVVNSRFRLPNREQVAVKMIKTGFLILCISLTLLMSTFLSAQDAKPAPPSSNSNRQSYSGMYSFLKEGEFVQLTVEDEGRVTGFISRFGDNPSQGPFINQFFKTGKIEGNKLAFTTQTVREVSFEFKGTIERGEGKTPADDAYYVLNGTLTENSTDANKKVTSHAQDVALKSFPQDKDK
jgi:hypothetical protein